MFHKTEWPFFPLDNPPSLLQNKTIDPIDIQNKYPRVIVKYRHGTNLMFSLFLKDYVI
jgi:hypothetical protein